MANRKITLKEDKDGKWGCPELDIKGWNSVIEMVEYIVESTTIPKEKNNTKTINKYHNRLSREMGCHQTPRFKIGEAVEVRKKVKHIRHHHSIGYWIFWDESRQEIEGKRAEIIDVDYTEDVDSIDSNDKAGCIGYSIKVEGRRGHIAVHEEALKKVRR